MVCTCTCGASFLIVLMALEAAPAEQTSQVAADWMQNYGEHNKDCLEWTNTCVNCVRDQSSKNFSCSNIPRRDCTDFSTSRVSPYLACDATYSPFYGSACVSFGVLAWYSAVAVIVSARPKPRDQNLKHLESFNLR